MNIQQDLPIGICSQSLTQFSYDGILVPQIGKIQSVGFDDLLNLKRTITRAKYGCGVFYGRAQHGPSGRCFFLNSTVRQLVVSLATLLTKGFWVKLNSRRPLMSAKHTPYPIEELDMALARLSDTISCLYILSDVCSETATPENEAFFACLAAAEAFHNQALKASYNIHHFTKGGVL